MSPMNTAKIQREMAFIKLLITNKQVVEDWINNSPLTQQYFDQRFKLVLKCIRECATNNVLLTKRSYSQFIRRLIADKMQWSTQQALFALISAQRVDQNDRPVLTTQILQSYLTQNASDSFQAFRKQSAKHGSLYATKALLQRMSSLVSDVSSIQSKISFKSASQVGLQFNKETAEKIKLGDSAFVRCGISEIDYIMGKGFAPGTMTLFCADVSGFKSGMMLNVGINIWEKSKKNVLYVPLEMTDKQTYARIVARQTKIKGRSIQDPALLTPQQLQRVNGYYKQMQQYSNQHNAKFYIMQPSCRIDVKTVQNQIKKHIQILNPDVVIIDYIANLIPEKGKGNNGRYDKDIGDMLKALRTMGKPGAISQKGFASVSGAQIGRQALKRNRKTGAAKVAFGSQDIKDSHDLSADSDTIFAQMYDPQNANRLLLFAIKSRHGGTTFANGTNMATLDINKQICLVQSIDQNYFTASNKDDILSKLSQIGKIDGGDIQMMVQNESWNEQFEPGTKTIQKKIQQDDKMYDLLGI